ncbi:MAG: hypothetical protein O7A09_07235 [Proteobacteria bacterium]|nr:hypothetical protein [Pseudomonadota bacterium]
MRHGTTGGRVRLRAGLPVTMTALWLLGCAGDVVASGKGSERVFHHRVLDYRISAPGGGGEEGPWVRFDLDGADLAFRNDGATMTLLSRCSSKDSEAPVMILARHLLFGIEERALQQSGPALVDGSPGWSQTFDTVESGRVVRIKSVTLHRDHCVFDWILVTPMPAESREQTFDLWWQEWRQAGEARVQRAKGERSSDEGTPDPMPEVSR